MKLYNPQQQPQGAVLRTLELNSDDGVAFWGCLLVISPWGVPLEFLFVGPIKPTPVQSILYGQHLRQEVSVRTIALPPLKAMQSRPCVVLLKESEIAAGMAAVDLPLALAAADDGKVRWLNQADTTKAEEFVRTLAETCGLDEPFQRASAALSYAATHAEEALGG